jgi:hypothetical protein
MRATIPILLWLLFGSNAMAQEPVDLQRYVAPSNASQLTNTGADYLIRSAMAVSHGYWMNEGFVPKKLDLYAYDSPDNSKVARAEDNGTKVYFDRAYRNWIWSVYKDKKETLAYRRRIVRKICIIATHEEGHTLGLGHTNIPWTLMYWTNDKMIAPEECTTWANRMVYKPTREVRKEYRDGELHRLARG